MKTTIEVYSIKFAKNKNFEMYSFTDEPDLYELFKQGFIKYIDKTSGDVPAEKRTVRIPEKEEDVIFHCHSDKGRYIHGIIETGLYGKEYDIADKDDPKKILYKATKSSAIMKPFFYYLKIPRIGDQALLILERTDNEGIFSLFRTLLIAFLVNHFGKDNVYNIVKDNIITGEYLNELQDGRYKSMTMSVNSLPKDAVKRYFCKGLDSEDFSIEVVVKFKSKEKQAQIKEMVNSGQSLFVSKDLNDLVASSEKKVVSTIGDSSKTRTFHLAEENRNLIRPYYELDVELNDKGFSSYDSIKSKTREFISHNKEFRIFD